MEEKVFDELLESVKEAAALLRTKTEPARPESLAKGEVYRTLYATMPENRGSNEWTEEECIAVRRALKPCFNGNRGFKALFSEMITERLNTIERKRREAARLSDSLRDA